MPSVSAGRAVSCEARKDDTSRMLGNRPQRPTALFGDRNRSESPAVRPGRLVERIISPVVCTKNDLEALQSDLQKKSGVLKFDNETFISDYEDFDVLGFLGCGTCGSVYKMQHKSRRDLLTAVKVMRRSSTCHEENKRILMDLHVITKSFDCNNIVECYGIFFMPSEVWICMEAMATCLHRLLYRLNAPFPESVIGKVTVAPIIDVKPSNMLLSHRGVIKLCDFGISGQLKDSIARSNQLGCIGYMAPERLATPTYDVRADIWSLGISLMELATCSFPYGGSNVEFAILSKIISGPVPSLPKNVYFSPGFRTFVEKCLSKDPGQRPKYPALMGSDFFKIHDSHPRDVFHWISSLLSDSGDKSHSWTLEKITPVIQTTSQSAMASSPTSTSTISPMDEGPDDSFSPQGPEMEHGSTLVPTVTLVAAPYCDRLPVPPSNLPPFQFQCINSPNGVSLNGRQPPLTQSRCGNIPSPSSVPPHDLCSQASSGYGSSASDASPVLHGNGARPLQQKGPIVPSVKTATTRCFERSQKPPNGYFTNQHLPVNDRVLSRPVNRERQQSTPDVWTTMSTQHMLHGPPHKPSTSRPIDGGSAIKRTPNGKQRSSSVGAQIRRTPARKWPNKPPPRRLKALSGDDSNSAELLQSTTPSVENPSRSTCSSPLIPCCRGQLYDRLTMTPSPTNRPSSRHNPVQSYVSSRSSQLVLRSIPDSLPPRIPGYQHHANVPRAQLYGNGRHSSRATSQPPNRIHDTEV